MERQESESVDVHPKMYMYRRIVEAKLYIDRHFAEKLDLEEIAAQASFSKYHFLRLFKNAFGSSPHEYRTYLRVKKAKEMLAENQSIADICYALGFESIPSFTQLFKKEIGVSPKTYQNQELERQKAEKESPFRYVPNCFSESYGWRK